jgi:AcrR family transcriptional regulator
VAQDQSGDNGGERLGRLPPGRHGLSREFVEKNQRSRITAAMISVVAEFGYQKATISEIVAAAGVSRRTFYGHFSTKEDCFFDTYEAITTHIRTEAKVSAARESEWPAQARARIASTLEIFSSNPDLARFCLIAPLRAGDRIAGAFRQAVDVSYNELISRMPPEITAKAPSPAVQQSLLGGMATLITEKVEAGEEELLELLPDLVELFLTPYVGRDEAIRVARAESP